MEEIWKPIPGYEGRYEVSSHGRVRRCYRVAIEKGSFSETKRKVYPEQLIRPHTNNQGYYVIGLQGADNKQHTYILHRLVALAFIPNPQHLPQINHKDEVRTNNHVENLEWCTSKYNMHYNGRIERFAKSNRKPVGKFDDAGNLLATFPCAKDAAVEAGLCESAILKCCQGQKWYGHAGGYVYKYLPKHKTL